MNDRIPTKPGRMKMTDEESGDVKYVYLEMADEPIQVGTDINKANLLADATAAAIAAGFSTTPNTPNEALALLAGGAKIEIQSYTGTGQVGTSHKTVITFQHLPKLVLVIASQLNSGTLYRVGDYIHGAIFPWSDVIAAYEASPSVCVLDTQIYFTGEYQRTARYSLSNNNKTISIWDANTTAPPPEAATQLNGASYKYTVISFY